MHDIRGIAVEVALADGNPLGAKGAGEGGIVAVAAAIGNAVSAALTSCGAHVNVLPLSPPRVWDLMSRARVAGPAAPHTRDMSAPS